MSAEHGLDDEAPSCAKCGVGIRVRALDVWEQGEDLCWECQSKRIRELEDELALARAEAGALLRATSQGYAMLGEHLRQTMDGYPEWRTGLRAMQEALQQPLTIGRAMLTELSESKRLMREHEASILEWRSSHESANDMLAQECEIRLAATTLVELGRKAQKTHACGSRCIWLRRGLDEYDTRAKEIAAKFATKERQR